MHELGMLGSPMIWALMADIGAALAMLDAAAVGEATFEDLEAHAREQGFAADLENPTRVHVELLNRTAPPAKVRAAA